MLNDDFPPIPTREEVDAARVRRRWITLAEVLGIVAVLISGLTLWNAYQQRNADEADKAAARSEADAESRTLLLRAAPDRDGRTLSLSPAAGGQTIQNQTIAFPADLGVASVDTVSEPRIEAGWFEPALLRARQSAGREENRGDERLPVAITTSFFSGGAMHRDTAIYDIGYRVEGGGLFGGHRVRMRGISRIAGVPAAGLQARLDALWRSRQPAPRAS